MLAPHQYVGGSLHAEMLECLRYYEKSYELATAPGSAAFGAAPSYGTYLTNGPANISPEVRFSVPKRATPAATIYSPATGTSGKVYLDGADLVGAFTAESTKSMVPLYSSGGSPTLGDQVLYHWTADAEI